MSSSQSPKTLPEHSMLVHVGPHKTGTTALQLALKKLDSEDARAAGAEYITSWKRENANTASLALDSVAATKYSIGSPPPRHYWDDFAKHVNDSSAPRVVVSAEQFALLSIEGVKHFVKTFPGRKLHILLALRPISELLPSQWQQRVQGGHETKSFDEWLEETLNEWSQGNYGSNFWYRHHYSQLIRRWGDLVGLSNVTAVVLDKTDRTRTFGATEQLLGVREGALKDRSGKVVNRSLTLEESESLRSMYTNLEQHGLGYLSSNLHHMLSPSALIKQTRTPHSFERKILLPKHAVQRVLEIQSDLVDPLDSLGINIIGELNLLRGVDNVMQTDDQSSEASTVPVDLVGWVATGIIHESGLSQGWVPPKSDPQTPITLPEVWLRRATGRQLFRELWRRVGARFRISMKMRD